MPNQPRSEANPRRGEQPGAPIVIRRATYHWYQKVWAVLLVTFCLEIGCFLLFFPWTSYWETNYFGQLIPSWHLFWYNSYLRGAVSGLGALNLYIAVLEIFRLRRFTRRHN